MVAKCAKGGYAAFATGAADREWAAMYIPNALLLSELGGDDLLRLGRGEISWKDPRVVKVFRYYRELVDLGAYAKTLLLERVPLRGGVHHPAEDPDPAAGHPVPRQRPVFDVGMLATGLMIATLPVLVLYLFLSEWFVKGMTAGAIKG